MKKRLKITEIAIGVVVLILGITIALLVKNANRIIKYELESFLGEGFSVERIDLHWGRVEALDISFRNPAGKKTFTTDSLTLEANFIGLLKKKYIISNLSLKNPYILLEKDKKGSIVNPFVKKGSKGAEAEKPIPPIVIRKIEIRNGSLDFLDRKASRKPVLTKLRNIDFECKDITYPLNDTFSTYWTTASIPGKLSTGIFKSTGKINPKTMDMDSRVEMRRLDITRFKPYFQKRDDVNVAKGTLDLNMDVKVRSKKTIISNLFLSNPYILLEKNKKGNLLYLLLKKGPKRTEAEKPIPPIVIRKIEIRNGSLDYLDRKASRKPVLTKLRNIDFECKDITYPLNDTFSTYWTTASIPGKLSTGIFKSTGQIKLKTMDTNSRIEIRKLDITGFKPYFQKRDDVNVAKGTLDFNMDIKVRSNKIHAPGMAVLRDLKFEKKSGMAKKSVNIPSSALIRFLKDNNNQIAVNFVLEGDLDNPKFSLREKFIEKVSVAIAQKVGLSIKEFGESIIIIGSEGLKEIKEGIEKGIEGIGEGLLKILDK